MSANQYPFYTPDLARGATPTLEALYAAADVLDDPQVIRLAEQGNLTVAMIRPAVDEALLAPLGSDEAAAEEVESHIRHLGELAKFSLTFDEDALEGFYGGGHAAPMEPFPPLRHMEYANRKEEFDALAMSGPTTVVLLHGPDAVPTWRAQLGHWNIEKRRDPATIRGLLVRDNYNNLLHGSDSKKSVIRELDVLGGLVMRQSVRR